MYPQHVINRNPQPINHSTIFKTFNSDIDKWTAKIGIFGKSFNELGTAVNNAFKAVIDNIDNFDENVGFWESLKNNLFSKNDSNKDWIKNSLGKIISKENIDSYIEQLDLDSAKEKLQSIFDHKELVDSNQATWSEFFDGLKDDERYLVDTIKNTNDLSKLTGEDLVKANQQAREAAIAHNAALKQQTLGAKAATVATKALAIAGNMIAMWAISEVIQLIYSCATATDRLKESAEKLGSQFSSTKSDIEDYKAQIKDLYDTINDSTSSYEDTYNARQNLLALQNEMIEKFGSEAESVSLVTAAINGQIDALDRLTEKEWQETVNEFNNDPDRSITDKIGDSWNSLLNGGATKLEQVCNEMENAEISFRIMPTNDETYKEFSEKVQEIFGASLTKSERDDSFTLSGNLEDIYEQLLNIQSLAADMGIDDSYLDDLDGLVDQATKAKSKLDQYNEIYSQHILYDKILQDTESLNSAGETYEEVFNKINDAYTEFYNASLSGDEDAVESAKQNFAEILQSATDGIDDQGVIDYFNSMYPDLQEIVGTWNFEVKFNAAINDENDNFENDVKNIFSQFATSDDILNYTPLQNKTIL